MDQLLDRVEVCLWRFLIETLVPLGGLWFEVEITLFDGSTLVSHGVVPCLHTCGGIFYGSTIV